MKNFICFILFFSMLSCKKEKYEKPILLSTADTLNIQNINVNFKTNYKDWKAFLFTFNQPIELKKIYKDGILNLSYSTSKINIESEV